MHRTESFCSLILTKVFSESHVGTPEHLLGVVLVIEPGRTNALFKFPGGNNKDLESPEETALRELAEEAGIRCDFEHLALVNSEFKKTHWSHLFVANVGESELYFMGGDQEGNEGEVPHFFTLDELQELVREREILPQHLERLRRLEIIPGLGL